MNQDQIIEYLIGNKDNNKQEAQLLIAIEDAVNQIKNAREIFDSVSEPRLIDYAIYMEQAAKARYSFLLSEAKRLNIKTQHINIFIEPKAV